MSAIYRRSLVCNLAKIADRVLSHFDHQSQQYGQLQYLVAYLSLQWPIDRGLLIHPVHIRTEYFHCS